MLSAELSLLLLTNVIIPSCLAALPVITEHPQDLRVHRGAPATLNCGAYGGDPAPTISWYKDGERVNINAAAGDHRVLLPGGSLLFLRTLHNHRAKDSGSYSCRAENQEGVVYSNAATLTVTYLKHEFGHVPKLITADTGEDIALSCFPPEGNPRPTIRWRRVGATALLPLHTDKYSLDPSGVLLVRRPTRAADAGQYECLVSNEEGTRVDSPVTLDIVEPAAASPDLAEQDLETYYDDDDDDKEDVSVPIITEASLLDRVTGLVRWTPVPSAAAYLVLVTAVGEGHGSRPVANFSVEASIVQVKLHSLDPDEDYSVSVAAVQVDGLHQPAVFSAGSRLSAATTETSPILREFTVHQMDNEDTVVIEEGTMPAHIWFLAVAIAILLTVLLLLGVGFLYQRSAKTTNATAACRKDAELGGGKSRQESPIGGGGSRSYYYLSGGSNTSWTERYWGASIGGGGGDQRFQTFKSDHRLLAADNHYDYVLQVPVDGKAVAGDDSGDAYQYFAHYASAPIIRPKENKNSPTYSVLLPHIELGKPLF